MMGVHSLSLGRAVVMGCVWSKPVPSLWNPIAPTATKQAVMMALPRAVACLNWPRLRMGAMYETQFCASGLQSGLRSAWRVRRGACTLQSACRGSWWWWALSYLVAAICTAGTQSPTNRCQCLAQRRLNSMQVWTDCHAGVHAYSVQHRAEL